MSKWEARAVTLAAGLVLVGIVFVIAVLASTPR